MKTVLVITKAISNAGDYLVTKCLQDMVKYLFAKDNIKISYKNGLSHEDNFSRPDLIVLGGGPLYDNKLLERSAFPLRDYLINANCPICIFGSGWYGKSASDQSVYSYQFTPEVFEFLNTISNKGRGFLGCRDAVTQRVLKNNGLCKVLMTGCPAWYNFEFLDHTDFAPHVKSDPQIIFISDPGITKVPEEQIIRATQAIEIIKMVKRKFPLAKLCFTFNNGIETKYSTICNNHIKCFLEEKGIEYLDIRGTWEGFKNYDVADLHIGFRVHSHIYCLSHRIPSVLIEEDARGFGVNETLGLPGIPGYDITGKEVLNPYANLHAAEILDELIGGGGSVEECFFHHEKYLLSTSGSQLIKIERWILLSPLIYSAKEI